ncbi:hypothetical protein [Sphingobium sp. B2]|uniref:hypothetical protein n=1 Tax=Sphingobium sp. B2 TaxID=2583228 RepID=UPI0016438F0C|nr:hypothetical protein [Sphingobium sp. B2]
MAQVWQADDALLDGLRDRTVIGAIITQVTGPDFAEANAREACKTKRQIVRDCLTGSNRRAKVEGWVPRWLRFPASS